ncbi:unnamed protein product [Schistosoma curassoni]|uniref:Prohibitin n=1 Tax=Schistosoma curassoni TaxID=6186 RepID=A0A183KFD6_9TREM|nr:unnamed protein product [Schistosoma curassoni]
MSSLFSSLTKAGVGLLAASSILPLVLYNVDGGHRAVIFDRFKGVRPDVRGEGTHFIIPWVQKPIIFDIRSRPRNVPVMTGSKDLQTVNITLRILFRPEPSTLPKIYQNLGFDYEERVLPSITTEVLKAVVAQFDASELITQRELVSQRVNEDLTQRASSFGILLDDIALVNVTAEQHKLAAIISAEGDSEAATLLSKSFGSSGEGLIELRRIEAAEDIAYQLSKNRNITYIPDGQHTLLNLPAAQ